MRSFVSHNSRRGVSFHKNASTQNILDLFLYAWDSCSSHMLAFSNLMASLFPGVQVTEVERTCNPFQLMFYSLLPTLQHDYIKKGTSRYRTSPDLALILLVQYRPNY